MERSAAPQVFLDITGMVLTDNNEDGLFGVAFAPDYATSGRFYVFFSDRDFDETIMRFRVSDDPTVPIIPVVK